MTKILIELQYFGTISWYLGMLRHRQVFIEHHENFEKSTYRNRCYIASPEGRLRLTIPLLHGRSQRSKYTDVRIDYGYPWQKIHWNSLCSCYRNSPYFEFYEDKLKPFFSSRYDRLFDFNRQLFLLMIELLELNLHVEYTAVYEKYPNEALDFRSKILPNKFQGETSPFPVVYHQVFQERTGFIPDLCIADLLFNEGLHARERLMEAALRD